MQRIDTVLARTTLGVIGFVAIVANAYAYTGHTVKKGPLTLSIGEVGPIEQIEQAYEVPVTIRNDGAENVSVHLEASVIDTFRLVGEESKRLTLAAGAKETTSFQVIAGPGTFSAHYPIRVRGVFASTAAAGDPVALKAVQVTETQFSPEEVALRQTAEFPIASLPPHGVLTLATLKTHRVAWAYYDKPLARLPIGWRGSEPTSRASFSVSSAIDRGDTRRALTMHPPYRPQGGPVVAEYHLALPDEGPITLEFFNAIRDHHQNEPPSDGVTFRVWAQADGEAEPRLLFERHTDSKRWLPGEADLAQFAGKTIVLGLESHPGPRRNTVCDSCYWGDPTIYAGEKPTLLSGDERTALQTLAVDALAKGVSRTPDNVHVFELNDGLRAAIALGPNGLIDGAIAFGQGRRTVCYAGLNVSVENARVGAWPSSVVTENVETAADPTTGDLHITHRLRMNGQPFTLTTLVKNETAGLSIDVQCDRMITDIAMGDADRYAPRVFFGHGYCVVEPEAFQINGGGHSLSTSHVAFEFENGPAMLMATTTPPDYLKVNPEQREYSLHVHPNTKLTLVPSMTNAFDAAMRYRPLCDKRPAAGVKNKAGRFVFDIWGSRFDRETALLRGAFAYGVTDAMVIKHVWQRWGYDNRLPDIYPPNPDLGGLEPLQTMAQVCAENRVLFGLHDNYIDFYPDADDYTYDCITFNEQGQPRKAWIQLFYDAQSYQWRPDKFQPFLRRNLELIKPTLRPTAYFVDVFTSANVFDYYDIDGKLHSRLETRKHWGECFDTIRETLGGDAPTVSEAGDDFLIGHLDGADCQFLQIGPEAKRFHLRLTCKDWSRVPWFDLVNHTNFSQHGVGYSGRYQGGRSRALHGIESDDYLSAELLTGHALMSDVATILRGSVRKYWLAQHIMRELADDEIVGVEFVDRDIRRLHIEWSSGTHVYVNRGEADWTVEGRVLPQYGFYATGPSGWATIERINGRVVESSGRDNTLFYVNGRGTLPTAPLAVAPAANRLEYLGERRFKLFVDWKASHPAPKDLAVFMHFFKPQVSRLKLEGWHGGGGMPPVPTSRWKGNIQTGDNWAMAVPEDVAPGEYDVLVGLYDSRGDGKRYPLLGDDDGQTRYRLGKLVIEGRDGEVADIRLVKAPYVEPLADRLIEAAEPTTFRNHYADITTTGGMRVEVFAAGWGFTPLPQEKACTVTLHLGDLLEKVEMKGVVEDHEGRKIRDLPLEMDNGRLTFSTKEGEFRYRIGW